MTVRPRTPTLALLALIVTGAATALTAADSAAPPAVRRPPAAPAAAPEHDRAAPVPTPAARRERDDPRAELARRFALAARNWTASNYPAAWRAQRRLATGRYRRALTRARPTRDQLAALQAEQASSLAVVRSVAVDERVQPPAGRVIVRLDEQTRTATQTLTGITRNAVRMRRRAGRWHATGWTVLSIPMGESAR